MYFILLVSVFIPRLCLCQARGILLFYELSTLWHIVISFQKHAPLVDGIQHLYSVMMHIFILFLSL